MEALKAFRIKTSQDLTWGKYMACLEELAPERTSRLLEPLGPVQPKALNKATCLKCQHKKIYNTDSLFHVLVHLTFHVFQN